MIVSPIIIAIFSASERAAMDTAREGYLNSVNLNLHTCFPYLVLNVVNDTARPRNPGFQVMHWHEDLQFIYVLQGEIEVRTLSSSFRACAGGGDLSQSKRRARGAEKTTSAKEADDLCKHRCQPNCGKRNGTAHLTLSLCF